jgi:hypothetical protein
MADANRVATVLGTNRLRHGRVFLSASFPASDRKRTYFESADPDEITQAIVAVAGAVLVAGGVLTFGGHPSVSPLIMMIAEEYLPRSLSDRQALIRSKRPLVVVYQSKAFTGAISESVTSMVRHFLAQVVWTPVAPEEKELVGKTTGPARFPRSLAVMRHRMLSQPRLVAAVFIGGMEGIVAEAAMFAELNPGRPRYFIGAPGGAAREVARSEVRMANRASKGRGAISWLRELATSREYPLLMQQIVRDIQVRRGGGDAG